MSKETQKSHVHRQLHPVVLSYVGSNLPLDQIIRTTSRPRDTLLRAVLLIEECLNGKRLAKDAINAAGAVPIKGSDPELLVLLLTGWAKLETRIAHQSQAQALLHRATALFSENTPYEIRAEAMLAESILSDTTGNKQQREKILKNILETLPTSSPRRKFYTWELAAFLALQGRAGEYSKQITEMSKSCDKMFPQWKVDVVNFVNAAETGQWHEAKKIMQNISAATSNQKHNLPQLYVPGYESFVRFATGVKTKGTKHNDKEKTPNWILIATELKKGNAQKALSLGRQETGGNISPIHRSGFRGFDLVRCELGAGNFEAAERLIDLRNQKGNIHYLDPFFRSRARLLAGAHDEAVSLFETALLSVENYNAEGRLELELELAPELTPIKIMQLARRNTKLKSTANSETDRERTPEVVPEPESDFEKILGSSQDIVEVKKMIERFADSQVPVLITGETGTGKELVARALHQKSHRANKPFVAVNCGAIAETLLESELFGHKRGAFTGAEKANKGLFQEADEGTILLDEIGEIPPRLQTALLRVLETGEIRSVGSASTKKIKCRILAATNVDLEEEAENKKFRKDLLFRLQRLVIHIPPLRQRGDDIMTLAWRFFDLGRKNNAHTEINPELAHALVSYNWPGNVRELRNVIERMRLMHSDKLSYNPEDFDLKLRFAENQNKQAGSFNIKDQSNTSINAETLIRNGKQKIRRLERLKDLFREHKKLTRSEIARIMGLSPNTVTKDLKTLIEEGFIERIEPSRSTRSHYFVLT